METSADLLYPTWKTNGLVFCIVELENCRGHKYTQTFHGGTFSALGDKLKTIESLTNRLWVSFPGFFKSFYSVFERRPIDAFNSLLDGEGWKSVCFGVMDQDDKEVYRRMVSLFASNFGSDPRVLIS